MVLTKVYLSWSPISYSAIGKVMFLIKAPDLDLNIRQRIQQNPLIYILKYMQFMLPVYNSTIES